MPNWLRIRNENEFGGSFFVNFVDPSGNKGQQTLGAISFERSESWQCNTIDVPDGANCWVQIGDDQSESNFNCAYADNSTAAYNYGDDGFSLIIEPN